jgi:hypothetical protein
MQRQQNRQVVGMLALQNLFSNTKSYVQNVLVEYAFCVEVSLAVQVRKIMRMMNQQS